MDSHFWVVDNILNSTKSLGLRWIEFRNSDIMKADYFFPLVLTKTRNTRKVECRRMRYASEDLTK